MEQNLQQMAKELYPFAQKRLGFNKPAKILFKSDPTNAKDLLGKTAYYDSNTMEVHVYTTNRHPKDILRSIAHELVHHAQNCSGHLEDKPTTEGYAQNDEHLRNMEKQAYLEGNMLFRDFEDQKKTGDKDMSDKKNEEINPLKREKANDHYSKKAERVYERLMELHKQKLEAAKKKKQERNEND